MLPGLTGVVPIWPPNWSQAFPDFLNALATGLAVAIVVLVIDRRRATRDARQQAAEDWQRLKPQLRPRFRNEVVDRNELIPILGEGLRAPAWMPDLTEYLAPFPLPRWRDSLKSRPLDALTRLERSGPALEQLCADYSGVITTACFEILTAGVQQTPKMQNWNSHIVVLAQLARNRVIGVPDVDRNWAPLGQLGGADRAYTQVEGVLKHPRVAPVVKRIQELLMRTDVDYAVVRAEVIPQTE